MLPWLWVLTLNSQRCTYTPDPLKELPPRPHTPPPSQTIDHKTDNKEDEDLKHYEVMSKIIFGHATNSCPLLESANEESQDNHSLSV